jgi:hypothetical protein
MGMSRHQARPQKSRPLPSPLWGRSPDP